MATRQSDPDSAKISYLVRASDGDFVIEIDPGWKVTFGAVNPGAKDSGGYPDRDLHCLRIWEAEKLRAVFCNVRAFRDLSIPLARKVQKETGSATWTQDSAGNFDKTESRVVDSQFVIEPPDVDGNDIPF